MGGGCLQVHLTTHDLGSEWCLYGCEKSFLYDLVGLCSRFKDGVNRSPEDRPDAFGDILRSFLVVLFPEPVYLWGVDQCCHREIGCALCVRVRLVESFENRREFVFVGSFQRPHTSVC